jgi:tRNA G37 N-methylase Trm5
MNLQMLQSTQKMLLEQEKVEDEAPEPKYLRIGDIIMLELNKNIFEGMKEYKKELAQDEDNLRLVTLFEKPDFQYQGVVFSDEIPDHDFKTVSLNFGSNAYFTFNRLN